MGLHPIGWKNQGIRSAFFGLIRAAAERNANLSFTPVLSARGQASLWRTGWVTDTDGDDLADPDGWKACVPGPPPMVNATLGFLTANGLRSGVRHADGACTPGKTPMAEG